MEIYIYGDLNQKQTFFSEVYHSKCKMTTLLKYTPKVSVTRPGKFCQFTEPNTEYSTGNY